MRLFITGTIVWMLGSLAVADDLSFNRDIRPILSDTCFFCHGPDAGHREADLRLDVESSAKDYAIVAGDSQASELIARVTSQDADLKMPPPESGKSLSEEQIAKLKQWIDEGAAYESYWAYTRPQRTVTPQTVTPQAGSEREGSEWAGSNWVDDPLDHYVLSKLSQQGLSPAAPADPTTLIRRLSFDLTGLPPTPRQVKDFAADMSEVHYRRIVDRLLASPAFGERMAIYWLDLVRYADTVGYHGDQDHSISPYRDYIIDAFNDDMPLDQFTREQLAGDLIPNATVSQKIASGYNRLLQTSHEGGVQPKEYLAIYAADRVRNFSNVWMGATVGCAQCHDHKYDPYTTEDFYSLSAFFADVDEAQHFKVGTNALPTRRPPEISVLSRWQRRRLAEVNERLAELGSDGKELDQLPPEVAGETRQLREERDALEQSRRLTMVTESIQPRVTRVLPRGDWMDDSGAIVQPSTPGFLGELPALSRRANRLDLANWLVDREDGVGGLTARVFANRIWYLLFGRGISSSLDDFGGQGTPPTHPELLDHLALDLAEGGWSVKRLIRRIVLSKTYRQSSVASPSDLKRDPYNFWFARQSRYRLPAEMVRDNVLSISGLLVQRVGGSSVRPHQPAGYYRHLNFPRRLYTPDRGADQYRRGVYVHWQRQFLHPMLKAMDAPSREECTAERPRSNTPLEALAMLNDPSMVDAAIAFASRLLATDEADARQRIRDGFWLATSRAPNSFELDSLEKLLLAERKFYADDPQAAESLVGSADRDVLVAAVEPVELAAWTSVARAMLNLYETVTRN